MYCINLHMEQDISLSFLFSFTLPTLLWLLLSYASACDRMIFSDYAPLGEKEMQKLSPGQHGLLTTALEHVSSDFHPSADPKLRVEHNFIANGVRIGYKYWGNA